MMYGSSVNGLSVRNQSDLDVSLLVLKDNGEFIEANKTKEILQDI